MKLLTGIFLCALLLLPVSARAADNAAETKPKSGKERDYVALRPISIPVINEQGLVQQVSIALSLECPMGKREDVSGAEPRLMDAYLRELYGALGSGRVMMRGNVVDVDAIKTRLTAVTDRIVGPGLVSDVLLQSVQQYSMKTY